MERKLTLEFAFDYETQELTLNINREGFEHFEKDELIKFLKSLTVRLEKGNINWIERTKI